MDRLEFSKLLRRGPIAWNAWRDAHPDELPVLPTMDLDGANLATINFREMHLGSCSFERACLANACLQSAFLRSVQLSEVDLRNADLGWANLNRANLEGADLRGALLYRTDLRGAKLTDANLSGANLQEAQLLKASLVRANLTGVNLSLASLAEADLSHSTLRHAWLTGTVCVRTKFDYADLTGCQVYGLATWDISLVECKQADLVITPNDVARVTVDHLPVAQFMYLLLHNPSIRDVIDTVSKKVVLILGRFTAERKIVLEALRGALRARGYSPVMFDFERPASRDLTETIRILAGLARFVIADITDAKSIPQELLAIVPDLPSVPVQPLLSSSQREYAMFEDFRRYPWVLPAAMYDDSADLVAKLDESIIRPAELKAQQYQPPSPSRS